MANMVGTTSSQLTSSSDCVYRMIQIFVTDENDSPTRIVFVNKDNVSQALPTSSSYSNVPVASVAENSASGTVVCRIRVEDPDDKGSDGPSAYIYSVLGAAASQYAF